MCSSGRRRRSVRVLILVLASLVSATIGALADDVPTVRIGVITPRDIMGPEYSWGGTLDHLSSALPQYRFVMEVFDRDRSRDAVENQKVDFIIGNPAQYVEMEVDFGISRIATVEFADGPAPSSAIGSLIFTRSDHTDIKTLDDVRGKRVVAIESVLFGGFQSRLAGAAKARHRPVPRYAEPRICRRAGGKGLCHRRGWRRRCRHSPHLLFRAPGRCRPDFGGGLCRCRWPGRLSVSGA